jgi:hypothetical protein
MKKIQLQFQDSLTTSESIDKTFCLPISAIYECTMMKAPSLKALAVLENRRGEET